MKRSKEASLPVWLELDVNGQIKRFGGCWLMEITDSDWFSLTVFVNSFFSFSFFLFFCSLFVKWIMRNAPACSNLFAVLAKYPSEDSPNLWVSLIPNSLLSVPPSLSLSLSFSLLRKRKQATFETWIWLLKRRRATASRNVLKQDAQFKNYHQQQNGTPLNSSA